MGVIRISPVERVRIAKYGCSFLERDAVLREIRNCFRRVPREHITVYTLIGLQNQARGTEEARGGSETHPHKCESNTGVEASQRHELILAKSEEGSSAQDDG